MSESTAKKLSYQNVWDVWDVWDDAGLPVSFFRCFGFSNMPNYLVGMMRDLGIYHSDLLLVSAVMNLCQMGGGTDTIISNASLGMPSKDGGRQKRRMQRLGYLQIKVVKKINAFTGRFETWGVQYDFSGFFKRVNEILVERGRIHSDPNIVAETKVDSEGNVILTGFEAASSVERVKVVDILPSSKSTSEAPTPLAEGKSEASPRWRGGTRF